MILKFFRWLLGKDEADISVVLKATKKVRINGVVFEIKKLDPFSHLAGFKTMYSLYTTYNNDAVSSVDHVVSGEKIKKHYAEILKSGIVYPKIIDGPSEEGGFPLSLLLQNMDMVEFLYSEILEFTYGKKKLRQLGYQRREL